jgi:hypothetical protein
MKSSPLPCYLVLRRPKHFPQHPILKHPQSVFFVNIVRMLNVMNGDFHLSVFQGVTWWSP